MLLIVFSLNMVVSFACSVSSSVHNSHHSEKSSGTQSHERKGNHGHSHGSDHKHNHDITHRHTHDADHKHSHHDDGNKENEDGNCCSGDVIKLQQSDRSIARSIDVPEQTTLFVAHDFLSSIDHFLLTITRDKYLPQHLRWPPATIPDIRIAIQSFQI